MKKRRSVDFNIKAAWLAISKMYNILGSNWDVSHSTGYVLLNIDPKNGTPATKIAPEMGMESRSLSRMLKTMEENEIIYRKHDDTDRRKVLICLTEKGIEKRQLAKATVRAFNAAVRENISQDDFENFTQTVRKITETAEQYRVDDSEILRFADPAFRHKYQKNDQETK